MFILLLHSFIMVQVEGISLFQAFWLTMTTVTTVGYGDHVAQTVAGRLSTIILIYMAGIGVLAQTISMYFVCRREVVNCTERGNRSWNMKDHIVFLNCPSDINEGFFVQAIKELRNSGDKIANKPIIIVDEFFEKGISDELLSLNVKHVSKTISNNEALEAANVQHAHTIMVLSKDKSDVISDSINFELVDRLRELGVKARVLVEVVQDSNRTRMLKVGADNVTRPIRAYPEFLMRSIIAPGSEKVIETLFDSKGEECIRYDIEQKNKWLDVVTKLVANDIGIPVAYIDHEGEVINNPHPDTIIDAKALFVIVRHGNVKKIKEVKEAVC